MNEGAVVESWLREHFTSNLDVKVFHIMQFEDPEVAENWHRCVLVVSSTMNNYLAKLRHIVHCAIVSLCRRFSFRNWLHNVKDGTILSRIR